jgi:hypothetical protein
LNAAFFDGLRIVIFQFFKNLLIPLPQLIVATAFQSHHPWCNPGFIHELDGCFANGVKVDPHF